MKSERTIQCALISQDSILRDRLRGAFEVRDVAVSLFSTSQQIVKALEDVEFTGVIIDDPIEGTSALELAVTLRRHRLGSDLLLVLLTNEEWSANKRAMAMQELGLVNVIHRDELVAAHLAEEFLIESIGSIGEGSIITRTEKRHVEIASEFVVSEDSVDLRGNLSDFSFPLLLHRLYKEQAEGALFLLNGAIKKIVYFQQGHPIFVRSNILSECLGNILVQEKLISEQDCRASLSMMKESKQQQGRVLIDMGVLSPKLLNQGLDLQLRRKLYDIFAWQSAEYIFTPGAKLPKEAIRLSFSNAELIYQGIKLAWMEDQLIVELSSVLQRYLSLSDDPKLRFQHLPLDEYEEGFVDSISGRLTVEQEIERAPLSDSHALALIFVLITTEICTVDAEQKEDTYQNDQDELRIRERLSAELLSLRNRDYFGILGVSATADDGLINQAYSKLARQYHPDHFCSFLNPTRQLAHEIFTLIAEAYQHLKNSEERALYLKEHLGRKNLSKLGRQSQEAEELLRLAKKALSDEDYETAEHALSQALRFADDPEVLALLGWTIYQRAPNDPVVQQRALQILRQAIDLDARLYFAYLYLGKIYQELGRTILAEKQFERALQCNPDCKDALDALELSEDERRLRRIPSGTVKIQTKV